MAVTVPTNAKVPLRVDSLESMPRVYEFTTDGATDIDLAAIGLSSSRNILNVGASDVTLVCVLEQPFGDGANVTLTIPQRLDRPYKIRKIIGAGTTSGAKLQVGW